MAKFTFVVLTNPVAGKEVEFNDWYDNQHIRDVVRVPGINSARRYEADALSEKAAAELGYRYLALYEEEAASADEIMAGIGAARERGEMPISDALALDGRPVQFEEIAAVGEAPLASPDRRVMIVFSNPREGQEAEFNEWYSNRHIHDVVQVPGIVRARRFKAAPVSAEVADKLGYRYAAIYDLVAPDAGTVANALRAAAKAGAMPMSDSFDPAQSAMIYYREIVATD